jgi:ParB family transcriptional regulator, chromosome partitioning protein
MHIELKINNNPIKQASENPQIQYEITKKEILEIRTQLLKEKDLPLDKRKGVIYDAPIDFLCPYPGLERQYTQGYIESLAQDIDKIGMIHQPTCTLAFGDNVLSLSDDSKFTINALIYIVCGNGRFQANTLLKKPTLRVNIKFMTDDEAHILAISENINRDNINPIDLAKQLQDCIDSGLTQVKIAERLSKTQPWVCQYLRLLNAPKKVQELLIERKLSLNQANKIFQVPEKEAQVDLALFCATNDVTEKQLEEAIKKRKLKLIIQTGIKTAESHPMPAETPTIKPKMENSRLNQPQVIAKYLIEAFKVAIKDADESSAINPLFANAIKKMYAILIFCNGNCNSCEYIVRCRGLEELK